MQYLKEVDPGVLNVLLLQVYIQYVKQVQAVDPQFVAINRDLDSLLHIADELALHAASYPPLTDIKPGGASLAINDHLV